MTLWISVGLPFNRGMPIHFCNTKGDRSALIEKLGRAFGTAGIELEPVTDVDPFTVYWLFKGGLDFECRQALIGALISEFGIAALVPSSFDSLPSLNSPSFGGDIDLLWELFSTALACAKCVDGENTAAFVRAFDAVLNPELMVGLTWVRPFTFLPLDESICRFLGIPEGVSDGKAYEEVLSQLQTHLTFEDCPYDCLPEILYAAWNKDSV